MTTPIRQPRSVEAATALCERYAELDGQIAAIEERRQADLAAVNADADRAANDLIAQRDAIAPKLAPWWAGAAETLTKGKRKSIELGGCEIGTVKAKDGLAIDGKDDAIIGKLQKLRWAKPFLRPKVSLDRAALLKATEGKRKDELAELGVTRSVGVPSFFVKRTGQGGTRGGQ
ncbi:host-nuclease inhibitor Gam family protein [Qipengyuania sp.]|uniref:host-nuclease inhibitor Gam family protein n=1 Tax=Qipengyuania sp. TaxID=2004515 RepID=UPI0035C87279